METELHYIEDHGAAIRYAIGCLLVALKERVLDFNTGLAAFVWSIAAASVAFALFHLQCAARGVQVLLGRPDGFLNSLVRGGADADLIDSYRNAMPIVIGCLLWLGLSHLAAAYFLVRRHLRRFVFAWCSA
ncbi:MAG TPA: hypothetical protein VGR05_01270, partial [Sphingomicrobium sp.]|nr:hypothetical protein [Sphingomicrobium sp.]